MPRPRKPASPFRRFNSSPEVIRLVVMMYVRFPLSLRNVEDLLFERGIAISHETVRMWWTGLVRCSPVTSAGSGSVGCGASGTGAGTWNSRLPFRRRERAMLRFRQMKSLQKFASNHANVHNHFNLERHLVDHRPTRNDAPPHWRSGRSSRARPLYPEPKCSGWRAVRNRLTAPIYPKPHVHRAETH